MFKVHDLGRFQADFLERITATDTSGALRIFHDTWFHGLLDGLADAYPATRQALGDQAFNAFARDYIRAHPLTDGDQTSYGAEFAAFFETHPHAAAFAWLGDLARLEWAEHHAHHAADAHPCDFEDLLDPQAWIAFHPSVAIVRLTSNAYGFRGHETDFTIRPEASTWLVGRDRQDDVIRLRLTPEDQVFIDRLAATGALVAALEASPPEALPRLQTCLAHLVQAGLLIQSGLHS
jgi:hypothetical protein